MATPVFDAASSSNFSSANPIDWTHVCTGSNLGLLVFIEFSTNTTITGATYNGVAMTNISGGGSDNHHTLWLAGPDTGSHTVSISVGVAATGTVVGLSYTSVVQSTPTVKQSGGGTTTADNVSITLAGGASGDLAIFHFASMTPRADTVDQVDFTSRKHLTSTNYYSDSGDKAGGASIVGTANVNNGGSGNTVTWLGYAVSLAGASSTYNDSLTFAETAGFAASAKMAWSSSLSVAVNAAFSPADVLVMNASLSMAATAATAATGGIGYFDTIMMAATAAMNAPVVVLVMNPAAAFGATGGMARSVTLVMNPAAAFGATGALTPTNAIAMNSLLTLSTTDAIQIEGGWSYFQTLTLEEGTGFRARATQTGSPQPRPRRQVGDD